MKRVLIIIILLLTTKSYGKAQYISSLIQGTEYEFLSDLDDTSLKKIISTAYISVENEIKPAGVKIMDIGYRINHLIQIPDSLNLNKIPNKKIVVKFRGYLFEYLTGEDSLNWSSCPYYNSLSPKEKEVLEKVRIFGINDFQAKAEHQKIIQFTDLNGNNKYEYIKSRQKIFQAFCESDYRRITFTFNYAPLFANLYIIPKKEWVYKYNLSYPVDNRQITAGMLVKIGAHRKDNLAQTFTVDLCERAYIVLFEQKGRYTIREIAPSSLSPANNSLSINLQQ